MPQNPPEYLPICAATVAFMGTSLPQTSLIWAGLRLHEAEVREVSRLSGQPLHHLAVPWCHVHDAPDRDGDAIYSLYPKDERYRFTRAANGAWVLKLADGRG